MNQTDPLDDLLRDFEIPPAEHEWLEWKPEHLALYPRVCKAGHLIEWPGDTRKGLRCRRCPGKSTAVPALLDWIEAKCVRLAPRGDQAVGCLVPKPGEPVSDMGYPLHGRRRAHREVAEHFMTLAGDERVGAEGRLASTWSVHHACFGNDGRKACLELSHLRVWSAAEHYAHHRRLRRGPAMAFEERKERRRARRRAKRLAADPNWTPRAPAMSPEARRERRRLAARARRAAETPEQRAERNARNAERMRAARA